MAIISRRSLGVSRETPRIIRPAANLQKPRNFRSTIVMPKQMLSAIQQRLENIGVSTKKRSAWLNLIINDFLDHADTHEMIQEEFITPLDNNTISYTLKSDTKGRVDAFLAEHRNCDLSQIVRSAVAQELLYKRRKTL